MPSHNQNTVDTPEGGNGKLGATNELSRSDTAALQESFPGSPIHKGKLTRASIQAEYQKVLDNPTVNGFCFSKFDPNYTDAPSLKEVKTGPAGLPGSPFLPNTASPKDAASANPQDLPAPPDNLGASDTRPPFVGEGTDLDPRVSSKRQSGMKIKKYIMGKSTPLEVGSYSNNK